MDTFAHFLGQTRDYVLESRGDLERLVRQVGLSMEGMLAGETVEADDEAAPGDFRGRLLYEDPQTGFIAVLMAWGPGALTPIHDHATWGVFGVCRGTLQFTNFQQVSEGRVRRVAQFLAGPGEVSFVVPPEQEIHQIHNPTGQTSLSLHIYGRNIGF